MSVLQGWSDGKIRAACAEPYRRYHAAVRQRHVDYFDAHPERRDPARTFGAGTLDDTLPAGWQRLAALIPPERLHRHHLSGGSSQMLALGLLGATAYGQRQLPWLFEPAGPFPDLGDPLGWELEYQVGFGLLNERPRTTDIDFFVSGPRGVLALEAKFTEAGMGGCSCRGRAEGRCDQRVLDERPYWRVARSVFGLQGPDPPRTCELSLAYQAVRNAAAAIELTGLRDVRAFGLIYDDRNPYFAGAGEWPGWAALLDAAAGEQAEIVVRAISWQRLIPLLPTRGRREVIRWAEEKHGLTPAKPA